MAIVYRKEDRIKVKVGNITVKISPLTYREKAEAQAMIMSNTTNAGMDGSLYALKCCIKEIEGLKLPDGSKYELKFEDDKLTDECVDDLTNIEENDKLFLACLAFLNGIPKKFINPITGEELEGVKIIKEKSGKK